MRRAQIALPAFALAMLSPQIASAATFVSFMESPDTKEFQYTAPDSPGDPGSISISTTTDFQVDLSGEGLGVLMFDDATISKTASVGMAEEVVPGTIYTAEVFDASFTVSEAGGGLIVGGSYGESASFTQFGGNLSVLSDTGSINTDTSVDGGSLSFTYGDALIDTLSSADLAPGSASSAVWTLTDIPSVSLNGDGYLTDFSANSSVTGNFTIIPTPGAASLLALGAAGLLRRRR